MKRLVIIDGNAIVHRAYHAFPQLTNKNGEIINAVYGFSSILLRVVKDLQPTNLIVAFDTPEPTFRNALYKDYQAKRPETEDNLICQIDKVHKLVSDLGIVSFALPGFEADDVIGTLAFQASGLKFKIQNSKFKNTIQNEKVNEVIIVTGDRDLLQLVDKTTKIYMPVKGLSESKLYGINEVKEKYGLDPCQIVDLKALTGDASDNYPGVTGIGPKTAAFLLQNFQTLDGIYSAIKKRPLLVKLSDKVITTLVDGHEQAYLCKKLAQIAKDAPVKLQLEKTNWHNDLGKIEEVLNNLGFKSLVKRIGVGNSSEKVEKKRKTENQQNQLGLF